MSRPAGLVLCCCCAWAILFSGLFAAPHAGHDCCGEGCPRCALIQGALNLSRQLRPAPPAFPPPVFLLSPLAAGLFIFFAIPASAVRLKVRINR
ncbi:MAG: hypothetical protein LBO76_02855 [Treponema sp.]|jgi:hypothetical protein|nr:hypothetical protein [Treponema sp.]